MIFEVTPEHIERLGDADLRTLVGQMAEQEAMDQGFSPAGVTYGGHQNAPDGGIDVRVDLPIGKVSGYIPKTQTGFQVKAEDFARADILKEMRPNGKLRQSIVDLAEKSGAYVIVSSKGSVADSSLKNRRKAMKEALADFEKKDQLQVDFYDRQRISTWVNQNPGLIPWVRQRVGLPISGWQPFGDWSSSPTSEEEDFLADDHLRLKGAKVGREGEIGVIAGVDLLREILDKPKSAIRLVGLSGVGKTKLAQALFEARLGSDAISPHCAIYTDLADEPDPVPLELLGHVQNLGRRSVLIIDNCGIELHRKMVARMQHSDAPVSLITIEYDIADDAPESTDVFKLEPASNAIIEKIIERKYPKLSQPESRTIAEFSEGNFRIALALAETSRQGESLTNLNDSELFKRLFRQRNEDNPALLRAAMVCSLVYSFDGETLEGDDAELPVLATLAGQGVDEVYAHVAELHRRQLVQKRSKWRAILPHALAHRLAKQALQDIPPQRILDAFAGRVPERLLKSFSRRLGCLHDSPEAQVIVASWLAEGGWLSEVENLNALGQTLLDNVAPVAPVATLECIEKSASRDGALYESSLVNQQNMIRLLRALAYDPEHFERAINLIAGFAQKGEASNNLGEAINVFESLFMIYLSGTHAGPIERASTILKFANSGTERDTALALAGLRHMLQSHHFSSSYGFEFGTRKRDYGYQPKSREDFIEWYGAALNLAVDMEKLPHLREQVRARIAGELPSLIQSTGMTSEIVAVAERFFSDGGWPEGWVGARSTLRHLKSPERQDDIDQVQVLVERLQPQTLEDRIAAYITPEGWGALDVVEVDFVDEEKRRLAEDKANDIAREIGRELAEDLNLLKEHLPTLAEAKSYRLVTVINSIGKHATDIPKAWEIIRTTSLEKRHTSSYKLAGLFIGGVAAHDRNACEAILDDVLSDKEMHPSLINMQVNVGLNAAGVERVLAASKLSTVPTATFGHLSYGVCWKELPTEDFARIMAAVEQRDDGMDVAFQVMEGRVYEHQSKKTSLDLAEKAAGKSLLESAPFVRDKQTKGHTYATIARACLDSESDELLARKICASVRQATNEHRVFPHDIQEFVGVLAEKFPLAVLDELIGAASDESEVAELFNSHRIGKLQPAAKIDCDTAIRWADEAPEIRYLSLAHVISLWEKADGTDITSNEFDESVGPVRWTEIAKDLLMSAPDRKALLEIMIRRFHPNGWSGSLAEILECRLPLLEELSRSDDTEIAQVSSEAIAPFKKSIEQQREWEAQHDRARDERFEW